MTEKNKKKAELKSRRKPAMPCPMKEATKRERLERSEKKHKQKNF